MISRYCMTISFIDPPARARAAVPMTLGPRRFRQAAGETSGPRSAFEPGALGETGLARELGGRQLLAALGLQPEHLDLSALGGDTEAFGAKCRHLADRTLDRAEGAEPVLSRIEDLDLAATEGRPCAGRRVAAADQVVDVIDVVMPVDAGLGGAAPAFVGRSAFVLDRFAVAARDDQVGRLQHRCDAQREEMVEVEAADRVVGADGDLLLQ